MISRPVSTAPHKARTSHGIRQLARDVQLTFPEMKLHGHLHDAARELDAGRTHSATRHLNAAIFGLQPQQVRRHGIHDDGGHEHAKQLMQQAYRHLLNVKDIEDMGTGNDELAARRRGAAAQTAPEGSRQADLAWHFSPGEKRNARGQWTAEGAAENLYKDLGNAYHGDEYSLTRSEAWESGGEDALRALMHGDASTGREHMIRAKKRLDDTAATHPDPDTRQWAGKLSGIFGKHIQASDAYFSSRPDYRKIASMERENNRLRRQQDPLAALSWESVMDSIELATFAGKPPGSGKNFAKLKGSLARRGASNPGALAAWIGRKKYGRKGFAKLSSHSHASQAGGIELVGPKGYVHGWRYVGGPGLPSRPPGSSSGGRFFMGGKQVSRHEFQQRSNASDTAMGLTPRFPHAGVPSRPPSGPAAEPRRVPGWVSGAPAARFHGKKGVAGDLGGGRGVVTGTYDHARSTITTHTGKVHKVIAIDATSHDMGFRGDVASSGLPADLKAGLSAYDRAYRTGGIYRNIAKSMGGSFTEMSNGSRPFELSARTAMLERTPAPRGKPGGPGLYDVKGMGHTPYLQQIVKALIEKRGMPEDKAYAIARAAIRKWGRGGGHVHPEVRAAAGSAEAGEEARQARAKGHANPAGGIDLARKPYHRGSDETVTCPFCGKGDAPDAIYCDQCGRKLPDSVFDMAIGLTGTAAGAAQDPRNVLGQFGTGPGQGKGAAGKTRAQRKAALLAQAKNDRARAKLLAIRIAADRAALASASGKVSKGQKGAVTRAAASKTGSSAPAAKGAAKAAASPLSAASTGLSPATTAKAAAAAKAAAGKMSKTQLTSAIKALTVQEKNLLAAAATAASQAARA